MTSINIRPGVNVLSVLRHLNYKPWFALAEFVDNSLQSFLRHRDVFAQLEGGKATLHVDINIDPVDRRIVVRDNAGGIRTSEFPRAFRAAELPPDRTGLSEFGMGMKSAACWFAPQWSARTSALGEGLERRVHFDIHSIVRDSLEELQVAEAAASPDAHYTEIVLEDVYKVPAGRTVGKIKEHLTDIYRIFIRQGTLQLRINGELLEYTPPAILEASHFKTPEAEPVRWLKDFIIALSDGREVYGFAAIRKVGSTSEAGFALFRRNRLIQGSADEGYRPEEIFGKSNSFVYQRLFGELHLKGFGVSHTKDGIQWDGLEEEVLQRLRDALDAEPLPLLKQAREYRLTPKREELKVAAGVAVERTASVIARELPSVVAKVDPAPPPVPAPTSFTPSEPPLAAKQIEVEQGSVRWKITLETSNDPAVGDWVEIFDRSNAADGSQHLGVRLSLAHPFTQRYSSADPNEIELLLRIAAALALAEAIARAGGAKQAGSVRKIMNELLRSALSK
jgi:Histidine kinase-, DNA gyrase B-, and HSP90-like ATPase